LIYVIGSGLSGVAAAAALIRRGFRPTILDAGIRQDTEAAALKARLASVEPDDWTAEDIEQVRRMGPASRNGIPRKLSFGSDFAYRDVDKETSADLRQSILLRSFASGGFSNVWGGVIQSFPADEFHHWPVAHSQLSRHYSDIQEFMQCPVDQPVSPSIQTRALYEDLSRHRIALESAGIQFDYAKLAIRTSDTARDGKGCRHCGLCLHGCPYDSIFSAATALTRFIREGLVQHVPGVIVDRISEVNGRIRIESRSVDNQAPRTFDGHTVFLAPGLLETVRILLNSTAGKHRHATTVKIRQSDIFTLPLLRYHSTSGIDRERLHTLCQMVVNITDDAICRHPVHLQLYGYNDLYRQLLADRTGFLGRPLSRVLRSVSERLFMAFGYLHSDVSSGIQLTHAAEQQGRLRVEGQPNPEAPRVGRAVAKKLLRSRKYLRTLSVSHELKFDVPGGGLRSGGCFPMRRRPADLETDPFGSIAGLPGVHLVDSSVLPTVPAGPLAFTVMANAHRIASECTIHDVR
jgi:choline dehydrogenase-like flavoprotein